jgi:acyl-CoA synthetase (AMP-forming)/AMP-acid ligase II
MSGLWNLWESLAAASPQRRILHVPGLGWKSVAEVDAAARALAETWRREPCAGRLVLIAAPNGPEWLASFLALQKLGAIVVAADPSTPSRLLDALSKDLGAAFIYEGGTLRKTGVANPVRRGSGLCLAKITSGSTGSPKAILFHADEMIADGRAIIEAMGLTPEDVNFGLAPFGHSYGLGSLVMPLLLQGNAAACASSPLPRIAVRDMIEAGVTVCPAVPAFFRALNETELNGGLGKLRLAISAGSALPPTVAADFEIRFGQRIHNFLGSSETGGIAYDADGEAGIAGSSVGKPMPGVAIAQGKGGRLVICGPAVVRHGNRLRYGGKPAFLLGDRGRLDESGRLVLHGRAVPLAKIGGRRVDPLEVERAIKTLPNVSDAYVRVVQVAGNDRLYALVENAIGEHALREALKALLPGWKIPRKIVSQALLNRDDRGKVKRSEVDALLDLSPHA